MISKGRPHALVRRDRQRQDDAAYRAARTQALARDGHRCRVCGAGYGIETHHVTPRSAFGPNRMTAKHHIDNLFTCCHDCHSLITGHVLRVICQTVRGASGTVLVERYSDEAGGYVTWKDAV